MLGCPICLMSNKLRCLILRLFFYELQLRWQLLRFSQLSKSVVIGALPCVIRDVSEKEAAILCLQDSEERLDLNPIEVARWTEYCKLQLKLNIKQLAKNDTNKLEK